MKTLRGAAILLLLLEGSGSPSTAHSATVGEWTTDSFLGFVQGTLEDGGANTYIAADGTVRLVNLWDLNRDGNLDLVLASTHDNNEKLPLTIYWQKEGFARDRRMKLPTEGAKAVAVADCNRDGRLDLVVANSFDGTRTELDSYLYWGGPDGFDPSRRTKLPTVGAVAAAVDDLDGDGRIDLAFANKEDGTAGAPVDTWIYWGDPQGSFSAARRQALPTRGPNAYAAADFDNDGRLDLALTSYHAGTTRDNRSYLYWNRAGGFDGTAVARLQTHSASGVLAADFDRDGSKDLFFACHSKDGNHRTDSFLYWGSPSGFSLSRRSSIPGLGPHFMTVLDIGNIYDRGERYGYISPAFDAGDSRQFTTIRWRGDTPFRTRLEFQVRGAASRESLDRAPWLGPDGPGSWYATPGAELRGLPHGARWIKYRASLVSPDSLNTPVLRAVTIGYEAR